MHSSADATLVQTTTLAKATIDARVLTQNFNILIPFAEIHCDKGGKRPASAATRANYSPWGQCPPFRPRVQSVPLNSTAVSRRANQGEELPIFVNKTRTSPHTCTVARNVHIYYLTDAYDCIQLLHMSTSNAKETSSTVLSVRVPELLKEQLDYLSRSTKRSKGYLATEALGDYVKKNAWRAKELQAAITEADKGVFISHDAMMAWADARHAGKRPLLPKPDVHPRKKAV